MGILDSIGNAASQVGGVFKGAGEALWETGEGLVDLGTGVAKTAYDLGPGGLVTDGYEQLTGNQAPDWMPSAERGMQRLEGAAEVAATIARNPGLLVDAVVAPIREDWNNGNYGEAIGRGIAEVALAVVGTKGVDKAGKLAKVGDVADTAADAARIAERADDAADAARIAERADDVSDAARVADASEDLSDVLARADTGLSVGGRPLLHFDSMDDFNRAANAARPDTVYEFGSYRWTTDDQARVVRAEGRVDLNPVGRNDPALQTRIGHEGRSTDVGFHVIADRLGGPTNRLNVVPGNGKPTGDGLPNINNGAYKRFENELAQLAQDGHQVDVRVMPEYNPGNATNRPDRFVTEYRVDGGDWIDQTFINK